MVKFFLQLRFIQYFDCKCMKIPDFSRIDSHFGQQWAPPAYYHLTPIVSKGKHWSIYRLLPLLGTFWCWGPGSPYSAICQHGICLLSKLVVADGLAPNRCQAISNYQFRAATNTVPSEYKYEYESEGINVHFYSWIHPLSSCYVKCLPLQCTCPVTNAKVKSSLVFWFTSYNPQWYIFFASFLYKFLLF